MSIRLSNLVEILNANKGLRNNVQLAQDIKMLLWELYDPNNDLIYPTINHWDVLLTKTIEHNSYDTLTKDEVLSILFGLIHHTRIVDGSWRSMFERGVTQKLLKRLLILDSDKF